jgi:predicted transcriptional regulator
MARILPQLAYSWHFHHFLAITAQIFACQLKRPARYSEIAEEVGQTPTTMEQGRCP